MLDGTTIYSPTMTVGICKAARFLWFINRPNPSPLKLLGEVIILADSTVKKCA